MNLPADFSDRLSPMLVKELRQGMRTNLFTVSFILLQAFMVICLMFAAGSPGDAEGISGFFWFFVAVALLGVMPIRGFSALHRESQINTMDLIQLTRLSAWRITYGKWLALVSQTLLLVAAILPYIVLRYFLGGIDFVAELIVLILMTILSMMLSAITVGFSAFPSVMLRGIVAAALMFIMFAFGFQILIEALVYGGGGGFGVSIDTTLDSDFWWGMLAVLFVASYVTYFFLDLGASRVAPESANHATRKRLIGLAFVLITFLIPYFSLDLEFMMILGTIALLVLWIDAITEKAALVPSIVRPFVRRGLLLRPFMYLLTPGWHTALLFVVFSACLVVLLAAFCPALGSYGKLPIFDIEFQIFCFSAAGCVLFPLVIIHLFFFPVTFSRFFFGLYLLVQICLWILTLMVTIASESSGGIGEVIYYLVPIPSVILVASSNFGATSEIYLLGASVITLGLSLLIPLMRSRPLFRRMRQLSREISAESRSTNAAIPPPADDSASTAS